MTDNEKLIEEARKAVGIAKDSIWRTSPDPDRDAYHGAVLDRMLAAFEKAHANVGSASDTDIPTGQMSVSDDEREALANLLHHQMPGYGRGHYEYVAAGILAAGFRRPVSPEPSAEEFRKQIADERARQIDDGYDILHDRAHGVDHLLVWAQDYARRGRTVQSAALAEAARELLAKSAEPQGEPSDAQVRAAFEEYQNSLQRRSAFEAMRAALRAAAVTEQGENR